MPIQNHMFNACIDEEDAAHLEFTDDSVCHKAYGYLAEAATGRQVGSREKRLDMLNDIGLKDNKFNRMYINDKKRYYDNQ